MVLIIMPFYLDYALHFPVGKIGLTMMAVPVSLVVLSPLSGWLYDRVGHARLISTAGLLISSLALIFLMRLQSESDVASIFWRLAMLGAGQSIFLSPNSASVLTRVEECYSGITSGILATARNFGMLTGAAIAGGSFSFFFSIYSGGAVLQEYGVEHLQAFMPAYHMTLALALALLLLGSAISLIRNS
jgi:MFS family permease